jgi:7-carboxy-7-deazaguanine synthase
MDFNKTLQINEIFYSIQGESSRAGMPCIFIRLQGCNLRCKSCDTVYAQEFSDSNPVRFSEIISKVKEYNLIYILFTGGEPLSQPDCIGLMKYFCDEGYLVSIETNGSIPLENIDKRIVKIMDLKCPSSSVSEFNNYNNISFLTKQDEVKFVIENREDFEWAQETCLKYNLKNTVGTILFSPSFGMLEPSLLAKWILEDTPEVRMQLQLHKYIWSPDKRGV